MESDSIGFFRLLMAAGDWEEAAGGQRDAVDSESRS